MKKREQVTQALAGVALGVFSLSVCANQSLGTSGYGLTIGPVFNRANIGSAAYNPANGIGLIGPDEKVRFGAAQVGGQFEVGPLDDLKAVGDNIKRDIDNARTSNNTATATAIQKKLNDIYLPALQNGARVSAQAYGSLLSPLLVRSDWLQGTISLSANAYSQGAARLRFSEATLVNGGIGGVTTASAFDVKGAAILHGALGYSTSLTRFVPQNWRASDSNAQLDLGVRANFYQAKLYRRMAAFVDASGNAVSVDFGNSSSSMRKARARSLDLGLMWSDTYYQLGAAMYNIGNPRLYYPDPSRDTVLANRQSAVKLASEGTISLTDSVTLKPHVVVEAALFTANRRWLFQSSVAANQTTNFVGEPQRYATAAVSYNAERFDGDFGTVLNYIVPSVRFGYRRNLVGSQLSSYGLGVSWGVLNLDVNASQESVNFDGSRLPRSAGFSLSIAEKY